MKIKGENVGVDLQVGLIKGTKSTSPCPDRGNPLIKGAVGPTASAYIMGTQTKVHGYRIQYTYTGVQSPRVLQRWDVPLLAASLLPRCQRRLQFEHVTQPYVMDSPSLL
jgi:hypothetical protein